MARTRGLDLWQVVEFYDQFGSKQDKQKYYEDIALADLLEHASFDTAQSVAEFGCGTGRFAEELLAWRLPHDATYWGCDVSSTMIKLSQKRLSHFEDRATLWKSLGEVTLPLKNESVDRFVSTYVLDILSSEEIRAVMDEASRVLKKDGLLCLTGLTHGKGLFSTLWTAFWNLRFALNPRWVGGCRPVALLDFLEGWNVVHHRVVVARGISSEVVVAEKR